MIFLILAAVFPFFVFGNFPSIVLRVEHSEKLCPVFGLRRSPVTEPTYNIDLEFAFGD